MALEIPRCYDSHLHLLGTGLFAEGLRLFDLTSSSELKDIELKPNYFRGDWLVGFGWNQYNWKNQTLPTHRDLDLIFPDIPVLLTRADGHAAWLNRVALERTGYFQKTSTEKADLPGGVIVRDEQGFPTGIFIDMAKIAVDQFLPAYTHQQEKEFLLSAVRVLNRAGFTHVRDMSGSLSQWNLLREIDQEQNLTLYVDLNFTCENVDDAKRAVQECLQAQALPSPHLKARGIKFYFDGALGSEGAFLSQRYEGSDKFGFALWPLAEMRAAMALAWKNHLEVSVHGIGDEAIHQILQVAQELRQSGVQGRLNLEHAQLIRPATMPLFEGLDVVCYMQPCHFLSDRVWLKKKLGPLYQAAFPWRQLQEQKVPIYWGSDSPIEEAVVANTEKALRESALAGIAALHGPWQKNYSHPHESWGQNCVTIFDDQLQVKQVVFDGRVLELGRSN